MNIHVCVCELNSEIALHTYMHTYMRYIQIHICMHIYIYTYIPGLMSSCSKQLWAPAAPNYASFASSLKFFQQCVYGLISSRLFALRRDCILGSKCSCELRWHVSIQVTHVSIQVTHVSIQVTRVSIQVTHVSMQVTHVSMQVTRVSIRASGGIQHC